MLLLHHFLMEEVLNWRFGGLHIILSSGIASDNWLEPLYDNICRNTYFAVWSLLQPWLQLGWFLMSFCNTLNQWDDIGDTLCPFDNMYENLTWATPYHLPEISIYAMYYICRSGPENSKRLTNSQGSQAHQFSRQWHALPFLIPKSLSRFSSFLGPLLWHMEVSFQARSQIRAAAANLHHGHRNMRYELHLWPTL